MIKCSGFELHCLAARALDPSAPASITSEEQSIAALAASHSRSGCTHTHTARLQISSGHSKPLCAQPWVGAFFAPSLVKKKTTQMHFKKSVIIMLQILKSHGNHTSNLITAGNVTEVAANTTKFWSWFLASDERQVENNLINTVAGGGRER